jgi:GTP-binding protein EngB required for normal cell division
LTETRDSLLELLHRCHRDELTPLCTLLRVNPHGLGLGDLARVLALTLRRAGSHGLGNVVLRKGEGRPYREILAEVAREHGIEPHDIAETELAVLRAHFAERWEKLSDEARAELWTRLELPGPPPRAGAEAVASAETGMGRGFGYRISRMVSGAPSTATLATIGSILLHPIGCLVRPFFAIAAPVLVWYQLRPDRELVLAAVLEVARLRQAVLHRLTIGVVGSPSTGKDAAVRALFGIDSGNISPIAGSTKEVTIQRLPTATALYVVNTPGLGDVVERVTEEARQVLDHIDVYLYVVNAEGGVQARELADYKACVATGKPVLAVLNKVDVLRPKDKDRYLADARAKLGAPEADFLAVAFDPLPQLAPGPVGVEAVHAWLAARLEALGKDPGELPPLPPA